MMPLAAAAAYVQPSSTSLSAGRSPPPASSHPITPRPQTSAVGFSGVIFSLATLESFLSPTPTRSVFGLFTVPTRIYPWALLLVLQLMPGISFLGHFSGLLIGIAYTR